MFGVDAEGLEDGLRWGHTFGAVSGDAREAFAQMCAVVNAVDEFCGQAQCSEGVATYSSVRFYGELEKVALLFYLFINFRKSKDKICMQTMSF